MERKRTQSRKQSANPSKKKSPSKVPKDIEGKVIARANSLSKRRAKTGSKSVFAPRIMQLLSSAPTAPFPVSLPPMLAKLINKPFDDPGWSYEVKWDGYRAVSFVNKGQVEVKSRNDISFNEKFGPIYDALRAWKLSVVIDGEIIVANERGTADFNALQNWRSDRDGHLIYYVFDLIWFEGKDLRGLPLTTRREVLKAILPSTDNVLFNDAFVGDGVNFYNAAKKMGLEGIIAKRADSPYSPGQRNDHWLKIKVNRRQEMVIGGYTRNEGTSKKFSSLLLGVYEGDKLIFTGKVGTGFNDRQQREMMKSFESLVSDEPPFYGDPDYNKPTRFNPRPKKAIAVWLKPVLVCEVSFAEMTSEGVMRHPSFEGMREDKIAKKVGLEEPVDTDITVKKVNKSVSASTKNAKITKAKK